MFLKNPSNQIIRRNISYNYKGHDLNRDFVSTTAKITILREKAKPIHRLTRRRTVNRNLYNTLKMNTGALAPFLDLFHIFYSNN